MAEQRYPDSSSVGMAVVASTLAVGARVWQGVKAVLAAPFADGTLAAAGRQGLDELGEALKAFPESIQVQESGSIWNPTQGEIAADRHQSEHGIRGFQPGTPSQIAATNRYTPYQPEMEHGREQEHEHRRDI